MRWSLLALVLLAGCQQRGEDSSTAKEPRIEVPEAVIPEREQAIESIKTSPKGGTPAMKTPTVEIRDARLRGNEVEFEVVNTGPVPVMSATVEITGKGAVGGDVTLSPRNGHVCFFAGPLDPGEKSRERFTMPRHSQDGTPVVNVLVTVLKAE